MSKYDSFLWNQLEELEASCFGVPCLDPYSNWRRPYGSSCHSSAANGSADGREAGCSWGIPELAVK